MTSFQKAVEYFLEGEGNGAVLHYFNDFGQCQESGRDRVSRPDGRIGFLGTACEIAWKQGVDLTVLMITDWPLVLNTLLNTTWGMMFPLNPIVA